MKTVLLLRHAKSAWGDAGLPDHDRPLNARGERAAELMADYLVAKVPRPDLILCSTAARTRQTLAPLKERMRLPTPPITLESGLYLASEDALLERLRALPGTIGTVLMIGHNDGMGQLANALAAHGKAALLASLRDQFPTGALAVLNIEIESWTALQTGAATLSAFACPRDLD